MEERSPKRATRVFGTRRWRPRQALARHHRTDAPGRNPTAANAQRAAARRCSGRAGGGKACAGWDFWPPRRRRRVRAPQGASRACQDPEHPRGLHTHAAREPRRLRRPQRPHSRASRNSRRAHLASSLPSAASRQPRDAGTRNRTAPPPHPTATPAAGGAPARRTREVCPKSFLPRFCFLAVLRV